MQQDEETFLSNIGAHTGIIRKVANSYCRNASDRDDLIQEITFQLWRSWKQYDSELKLSTWIYRVAINVAISFFRKSKRHLAVCHLDQEDSRISDAPNQKHRDNVNQLYQFIAELDELNRAIMLLYLERYSHEEIAQSLGISKSNVATKVGRIKAKLKIRFEHEECK